MIHPRFESSSYYAKVQISLRAKRSARISMSKVQILKTKKKIHRDGIIELF
jgi:hypothetical protein